MNQLDEILDWFEVATDSSRVITKFIDSCPEKFPSDVVFAARPINESKKILSVAREEINDLVIVLLVSVFEKIVIDYLTLVTQKTINDSTDSFARSIMEYGFRNVERWPFPNMLDFFKSVVNPQVVGDVKQVYHYRNWVAHGRKGAKPLIQDPKTAYERLSEFLFRAGL